MSEESDTREQVEEGAEEDLDLTSEDAEKVGGGDIPFVKHVDKPTPKL
jgi:hypothetical protein